MNAVLDSWAVLRYLEGAEPAYSQISTLLDAERPVMSWINLGEVFYVLHRRAGEAEANGAVRDLRTVVEAELPTGDRVMAAARIKATHALSYADAFAAATARAHDVPVWTGDPELLVVGAPWRWHDLRR